MRTLDGQNNALFVVNREWKPILIQFYDRNFIDIIFHLTSKSKYLPITTVSDLAWMSYYPLFNIAFVDLDVVQWVNTPPHNP